MSTEHQSVLGRISVRGDQDNSRLAMLLSAGAGAGVGGLAGGCTGGQFSALRMLAGAAGGGLAGALLSFLGGKLKK